MKKKSNYVFSETIEWKYIYIPTRFLKKLPKEKKEKIIDKFIYNVRKMINKSLSETEEERFQDLWRNDREAQIEEWLS